MLACVVKPMSGHINLYAMAWRLLSLVLCKGLFLAVLVFLVYIVCDCDYIIKSWRL